AVWAREQAREGRDSRSGVRGDGLHTEVRADAPQRPAGRITRQANTATLAELRAGRGGTAAAVLAGDRRHLLQTSGAVSARTAGSLASASGVATVPRPGPSACRRDERCDHRSRTQAVARA